MRSIFGFFAVSTVVFFGMHYYVWRRIVRDTKLAHPWRTAATALLALLALSFYVAFLVGPRIGPVVGGSVAVFGYGWLGVLFYLDVLLLGSDVLLAFVALARWIARKARPPVHAIASAPAPAPASAVVPGEDVAAETTPLLDEPVGRRVFLARAVGAGVVATAGAISIAGVHSALGELEVVTVPIRLARLPRALSGYRILMISDVHIGPMLDRRFLRGIVEKINGRRPDAVVIVGDLVDGSVDRIGVDISELTRLRSRDGTFFVTGNHEYYSGAEEWIAYLKRIGIRVLENERVALGDRGHGGATFDLAGVYDLHASRALPPHAPDVHRAVLGRDPERELVLLAHQPGQIVGAAAVGAGLQLSGHTHGGQLFPWNYLVALTQPYLAGLHTHNAQTQIYVSRGTGFWGPPMRVLAPAEITELVLVPA